MIMSGKFLLSFLILWPFIGGLLSYFIGRSSRRARDYFADCVCLIEFIAAVLSYKFLGCEFSVPDVCGLGIKFMLDGFRFIYAVIIAFMWLITTVFSREYLRHHRNRNRYYLYVLMTLGSIMGVFLSGDLYTTFLFFEMMSLFSYIMVVQEETPEAQRAAQTYLAIAIIGGLVTLTGLILFYARVGTLDIDALGKLNLDDKSGLYVPGFLIFVGFAAKAAIFPSHIWLPTAHTAAPAPSSALLSGLLTKSGLFGVIVLSAGPFLHDKEWGFILIILAVITMVLGAVLAVFSINIKRTLACSSMSQLGFILTGISMQCFLGAENDLAVRGTVLYMVGHSLIKLVLFFCAGIIFMNTHQLNLNDIKGFGRGKKIFMFAFLMGALGLMGAPLWNGYIGKTLIHESIVEHIHALSINEKFFFQIIEWLFLISGGLTAAYMIKLFIALFIARPSPELHQKEIYIEPLNAVLLTLSALILPVIGFFPNKIGDAVGILGSGFMHGPEHHHAVNYFSLENLEGAVISIVIGVCVYIFFIQKFLIKDKKYLDLWPVKLNIENLIFRPVIAVILPFIGALFARLVDLITAGPVALMLSNMSRIKFIKPPEDTDFGFYHDEAKAETVSALLPSSLPYGLVTFAIGLLFVIAFLMA
ncbi:MAG: proton-conducting transporter membrane subunit [Synergistales bacterium]|nr:proton-conducting transporter membrane subunit [Synergistales bacterium]MDY6401615.1 proton-conducting transporter membrane subunit [Synergistales bacterium]MDY6404311.1 proton-conducting transporter membrane subunit [Synergistales bacterium]MDY6410675.1 proton-conducting transporter membrane subunit [Synergistales bacterium]MDY6414012.1 proton-conducting transporter membrane subunit [Synergistales bacterium]